MDRKFPVFIDGDYPLSLRFNAQCPADAVTLSGICFITCISCISSTARSAPALLSRARRLPSGLFQAPEWFLPLAF